MNLVLKILQLFCDFLNFWHKNTPGAIPLGFFALNESMDFASKN